MNRVCVACLVLIGLIHLAPMVGLAGAERLVDLYGLQGMDPQLTLLLRHRALLFGLLGSLCVAASVVPEWRPLAFAGAAVSVVGFLVLVPETVSPAMTRVVVVDGVALVLIVVGAGAEWLRRGSA